MSQGHIHIYRPEDEAPRACVGCGHLENSYVRPVYEESKEEFVVGFIGNERIDYTAQEREKKDREVMETIAMPLVRTGYEAAILEIDVHLNELCLSYNLNEDQIKFMEQIQKDLEKKFLSMKTDKKGFDWTLFNQIRESKIYES